MSCLHTVQENILQELLVGLPLGLELLHLECFVQTLDHQPREEKVNISTAILPKIILTNLPWLVAPLQEESRPGVDDFV